jgi:hypothetical protein
VSAAVNLISNSIKEEEMKRGFLCMALWCFLVSGCDGLRFAPTEAARQNAWLHNRTASLTAEMSRTENSSEKLRKLAGLSELQSRAVLSYYGLPRQFPRAASVENVLSESSFSLADAALAESAERPDGWQLADTAIEMAIGIGCLFGGAGGLKLAGFLKTARTKSLALREIITANESFKKQNADYAAAFKQAQNDQSPQTRQIVAAMKG